MGQRDPFRDGVMQWACPLTYGFITAFQAAFSLFMDLAFGKWQIDFSKPVLRSANGIFFGSRRGARGRCKRLTGVASRMLYLTMHWPPVPPRD